MEACINLLLLAGTAKSPMVRFFFPSGAAVLIYLRATRCTTLSLRGGASNAFFKFEHAAYHKTVHDFLKNFWRTAVEFFMFVLEGANHS